MDQSTAVKQLQKVFNTFPWDELGKPRPNLSLDGIFQGKTRQYAEYLKQVGEDFNEPNLKKMTQYILQEDFDNAQSVAYVAKSQLDNALHQFRKIPSELIEKHPDLRRWTQEEMKNYMRTSSYPGYFPKPWALSRLGKRDFGGKWNCTGPKCQASYYEEFMNWRPGSNGIGGIYDPRLYRNMDKHPKVWSNKMMKQRIRDKTSSPHIPSPGIGHWIDIKSLPAGKVFLDKEDEVEYMRLLNLYKQFVQEEKERGTAIILPPPTTKIAKLTGKLVKKYYL